LQEGGLRGQKESTAQRKKRKMGQKGPLLHKACSAGRIDLAKESEDKSSEKLFKIIPKTWQFEINPSGRKRGGSGVLGAFFRWATD